MFKHREWTLEFLDYLNSEETKVVEKTNIWEAAIGLQDVDNLKPSKYLIKLAKKHIENKINIDEVENKIEKHYSTFGLKSSRNKEPDMVAVHIVKILNEKKFKFLPGELSKIHKKLFTNVFDEAGNHRKYNFYKKEWILNGDTVEYSSYEKMKKELTAIFNNEKRHNYRRINDEDIAKTLSKFVSEIWKVHPFCEGNTRTIAIFLIKYLQMLGYNVNIKIFIENSWYFRNTLVRANYENKEKNVNVEMKFLEEFIENLLNNKEYNFDNNDMHI